MFWIDPMSRQPIYEQLIEQAEKFILSGVLAAGAQFPSVRGLSLSLSVNPNTIQKAYNELERRGILRTVPGKGSFVAADAVEQLQRQKRDRLTAFDTLVRELILAGIAPQELRERIERLTTEGKENSHD